MSDGKRTVQTSVDHDSKSSVSLNSLNAIVSAAVQLGAVKRHGHIRPSRCGAAFLPAGVELEIGGIEDHTVLSEGAQQRFYSSRLL